MRHPDFVLHLLNLDLAAVLGAVRSQRASLRSPPLTREELLGGLAQVGLALTVAELRRYEALL